MTNVLSDHGAVLERFQAVAEGTRLRIVQLLSGGERCVCDLQEDLDAAQSRLSFHLKKLKDAGVVRDERRGRWVYYSLVPEALAEMRSFLGAVEPGAGAGAEVGEAGEDLGGCGPGCCCGA
jgi:ArsR family transcriptional regulator, arsenate/arsenite/antimonite-responsive transcriptional repressor